MILLMSLLDLPTLMESGGSALRPTMSLPDAQNENCDFLPPNCARTIVSNMAGSKSKLPRSSSLTSGERTQRKKQSCASSATTEKPGQPSKSLKEESAKLPSLTRLRLRMCPPDQRFRQPCQR